MASGDIDVAYVAKLARLALEPAEIERFGAQLGALLEYVKALEALPVADVAATAQVIPSTNVMRDDVAEPSLPRDAVLAAAPQREGAYFRVPRIIAEEA
ncbi:MAG: Asp-tRNA(Asn)/Glu-tRNA(Gln) amidotransferase subunit GatC [Candidatus Baltobacteraceae bacterium]